MAVNVMCACLTCQASWWERRRRVSNHEVIHQSRVYDEMRGSRLQQTPAYSRARGNPEKHSESAICVLDPRLRGDERNRDKRNGAVGSVDRRTD